MSTTAVMENERAVSPAGIRERLSGNEAVAIAIKQIHPDVFPAFPITPSTEIPQYFSSYVANGEVQTEFVPVESEHSAMSAAIGAQSAGARTMTATSSCGLALMWEEFPILMTVLTMIFGLFPLVVATGVGANGNRSLGTGVAVSAFDCFCK